MSRLRVLISAYACQPGRGSEPGVGWNVATGMARHHDVWVLTRAKNRPSIEEELRRHPVPGLHFEYYDLPRWAGWWRQGQRGVQLYYYLWQLGAYRTAARLHQRVMFDVGHHVTFVKYWSPSMLALLKVPYVWGPVGGGESTPKNLWRIYSLRGKIYESTRDAARWLGEHDPLVRLTARRSRRALATTPETARRLLELNAGTVRVFGESGLNSEELEMLSNLRYPNGRQFHFVSVGRLLHWKGFHLGIRAFAQAGLENADYWIIGDGPELERLQALSRRLKVADRVNFFGQLSREDTLNRLGASHALVHPSLHDSGGWVCLEAMASGRPVLCLDLGGPAMQVTRDTGIKVPPGTPAESIGRLALEMRKLASDRELCEQLGKEGRRRVDRQYRWERKIELLSQIYLSISSNRHEEKNEQEPIPLIV